jgi:hypothetical protein
MQDTSLDAYASVDTTRLEKMVLETIRSFGGTGCISDEVRARLPGLAYSSVTARFSALIAADAVRVEGKRKGASGRQQRVMVAAV